MCQRTWKLLDASHLSLRRMTKFVLLSHAHVPFTSRASCLAPCLLFCDTFFFLSLYLTALLHIQPHLAQASRQQGWFSSPRYDSKRLLFLLFEF